MNIELVSWITWGFQALIAFACWIIWTKIDKNTEAITQLRVDLPTYYLTKKDFQAFRTEDKVTQQEKKEG